VDNDYLELPKMSLTSLLRWLALLEVVVGTAGVIVFAIVFGAGVGTAALVFISLKGVVFIAILLYSLSYMMPSVKSMKTFLGMPIQKLLRYSIYAILTLGLIELILNITASTLVIAGGAFFMISIITGLLSTITAAVVFLAVQLLIQTKKTPETKETKLPAAKTKSATGRGDDWVDSLLKDMDRPDKPTA